MYQTSSAQRNRRLPCRIGACRIGLQDDSVHPNPYRSNAERLGPNLVQRAHRSIQREPVPHDRARAGRPCSARGPRRWTRRSATTIMVASSRLRRAVPCRCEHNITHLPDATQPAPACRDKRAGQTACRRLARQRAAARSGAQRRAARSAAARSAAARSGAAARGAWRSGAQRAAPARGAQRAAQRRAGAAAPAQRRAAARSSRTQ